VPGVRLPGVLGPSRRVPRHAGVRRDPRLRCGIWLHRHRLLLRRRLDRQLPGRGGQRPLHGGVPGRAGRPRAHTHQPERRPRGGRGERSRRLCNERSHLRGRVRCRLTTHRLKRARPCAPCPESTAFQTGAPYAPCAESTAFMDRHSRYPGFHKLTIQQRRKFLQPQSGLSEEQLEECLCDGGWMPRRRRGWRATAADPSRRRSGCR